LYLILNIRLDWTNIKFFLFLKTGSCMPTLRHDLESQTDVELGGCMELRCQICPIDQVECVWYKDEVQITDERFM